MERTDKKGKSLWRRKQYPEVSGVLVLRRAPRRRVKFGERIWATPEELGAAIKQFDWLEGVEAHKQVQQEVTKEEAPIVVAKEEYRVVGRGRGGWFDVFSPEGKKMNEKALKAEEAEALKESLEQEQPQP